VGAGTAPSSPTQPRTAEKTEVDEPRSRKTKHHGWIQSELYTTTLSATVRHHKPKNHPRNRENGPKTACDRLCLALIEFRGARNRGNSNGFFQKLKFTSNPTTFRKNQARNRSKTAQTRSIWPKITMKTRRLAPAKQIKPFQ